MTEIITDVTDNMPNRDSEVGWEFIFNQLKMVNFKKTKSLHPRRRNKSQNPPGTTEVTQRDEKKVGMEIFENISNIIIT